VVLGFLVAAMARPSLATGVALVALFALFHGHAHGAEAPSGDVVGYAAGFVLATAGLHVLGIAFASGLAAARRPAFIRMMGRGIALVGIVLA
jgi:urease accessory protein